MGKANKKIQSKDVFDEIDEDNMDRRTIVNVDDSEYEVDQDENFDEDDVEEDIEDFDKLDLENHFDDDASRSLPADWQDFDYYDDEQDDWD